MPKIPKVDNLKWLVTNAINGDVSGDDPEQLTKMLATSQELQAIEQHFKDIEKGNKNEAVTCAVSLALILEQLDDKKLTHKVNRLFMEIDKGIRKLFAIEDKKFRDSIITLYYKDRIDQVGQIESELVRSHLNALLKARLRKAYRGENDNRNDRLNKERTIAE
jgi:hypothetical protein